MKKSILLLVIISFLLFSTSCEKDKFEQPKISNSDSAKFEKTVNPWIIGTLIGAVVAVVVEISEGQYSSAWTETHYGSNGQIVKVIQHPSTCSGVGSCAISGVIHEDSPLGGGESLSDEELDIELTYTGLTGFIGTLDNDIVFFIDDESEGYEVFFNNDVTFTLSKPYKINNPSLFEMLEVELEEIIIYGDYEIHFDSEGQKYIIIATI